MPGNSNTECGSMKSFLPHPPECKSHLVDLFAYFSLFCSQRSSTDTCNIYCHWLLNFNSILIICNSLRLLTDCNSQNIMQIWNIIFTNWECNRAHSSWEFDIQGLIRLFEFFQNRGHFQPSAQNVKSNDKFKN